MCDSNDFTDHLEGEILDSNFSLVSHQGVSGRPDLDVVEEAVYKRLFQDHLAWLLRTFEINCVIDVGANVGQYARNLREVGYCGHIISFEPVRRYFTSLSDAAKDDPCWSVYPLALGQQNGVAPMNVVSGTGSSLRRANAYGRARWDQFVSSVTENVTVRRLDVVLDDITVDISNPRLYLKMDTQGYDVDVFYGLGDRIKEFIGMQSELSLLALYEEMPDMLTALEVYRRSGFEITGMFPVTRERLTGRLIELDCVMVRTSRLRGSKVQSVDHPERSIEQ